MKDIVIKKTYMKQNKDIPDNKSERKNRLGLDKGMEQFYILLIVMLCIFAYFLSEIYPIIHYMTYVDHFIILPIIASIILLIPSLYIVYHLCNVHRFKLASFGFTLKNWRTNIFEALLFSIVVAGIIVGLKWLNIHFDPEYQGLTTFNDPLLESWRTYTNYLIIFAIVLLFFSIAQEIVVRGILQTILSFRFKTWVAIIVSNLIFSALHLVNSLNYAVGTFFLGLFWGWLFVRQKSLLGVCFSHFIIGTWTILIVGVNGWIV